jgi:hypothetical protein
MPYLKDDNSVPTIVWRGRTNNGSFNIKDMMNMNKIEGSFRTNNVSNYMIPTELGARKGIADNQSLDEGYLQPQQLNPYALAKSPFHSNRKGKRGLDSLYPTFTYGDSNVNELASMGGSPLAIALDIDELPARMQSEKMRTDSNNPLSQSFAIKAAMAQDRDPIKGPLTDIMRYGVAADFESQAVSKSRFNQGYVQTGLMNEEKRRKVLRQIKEDRDVFSQDVNDFKDLFLKQVGNLGDQEGKNVQEQLETISKKLDNWSMPANLDSDISEKKKPEMTTPETTNMEDTGNNIDNLEEFYDIPDTDPKDLKVPPPDPLQGPFSNNWNFTMLNPLSWVGKNPNMQVPGSMDPDMMATLPVQTTGPFSSPLRAIGPFSSPFRTRTSTPILARTGSTPTLRITPQGTPIRNSTPIRARTGTTPVRNGTTPARGNVLTWTPPDEKKSTPTPIRARTGTTPPPFMDSKGKGRGKNKSNPVSSDYSSLNKSPQNQRITRAMRAAIDSNKAAAEREKNK